MNIDEISWSLSLIRLALKLDHEIVSLRESILSLIIVIDEERIFIFSFLV